MAYEPRQQLAHRASVSSRIRRLALKVAGPLALTALSIGAMSMTPAATHAATADHLMCGWRAEYRTQTVSIDPGLAAAGVTYEDVLAAFAPWNDLFLLYHGFAIFQPYEGNWWEADILLTAQGFDRTWVQGQCSPGYQQRGANHSIVFLGAGDAWRNRTMLAHEMGHALGLADHGAGDASSGHIGFKPCANYIGVMSYCTSPQSWFINAPLSGFVVDGELIRDYWRP